MAMIDFSIKHGRTVVEAAAKLRTVVDEARGKLGAMIREVTWGPDGRAVKLTGTGFHVDLRVAWPAAVSPLIEAVQPVSVPPLPLV